MPACEHGEHASRVGADGEKRRLRQAHLPGKQHDVGRQAEKRMNPDRLRDSEIEINQLFAENKPPGRNTRNANSSSNRLMARSVTPRTCWNRFAKPPPSSPATMAHGMLPSPPITVTISPLT